MTDQNSDERQYIYGSNLRLDELINRIEPRNSWKDLSLPQSTLTELKAISEHFRQGQELAAQLGFDKLGRTNGVKALFTGPSGTGKTMAAEVLAHDLKLDLYRIDLSSLVSKYIGETEKNLDKVFSVAESANVVLFFDEADALFGKRTDVADSHDRFANMEAGYLLQRIETYSGIAILATNLRENIDPAFMRRLEFVIEFPVPGSEQRKPFWQRLWQRFNRALKLSS